MMRVAIVLTTLLLSGCDDPDREIGCDWGGCRCHYESGRVVQKCAPWRRI